MGGIGTVHYSDGSTGPFDEGRVAARIRSACLSAGEDESDSSVLAEQVAAAVTIFITNRFEGREIRFDQIEDMVENVLTSLGKVPIARAFITQRERASRVEGEKARTPAAPVTPAAEAVSATPAVTVHRERADETLVWDAERIVATLVRETDLSPGMARHVARAVEHKVRTLGAPRLSSGLVRELVDAELAALGFRGSLDRQRLFGLPRAEIERAAFDAAHARELLAPAPSVDTRLGRHLLSSYAGEVIYSAEVMQAHRDGAITIGDPECPFQWHEAYLSLEDVRRHGFAPPDSGKAAAPPGDLAGFFRQAGSLHRWLRGFVSSRITYHHLSLVLAPLVRGWEVAQVDDALLAWLDEWTAEWALRGPVRFDLPATVPPELRAAMVIVPGGEEVPYAALEGEVRGVARSIVRALNARRHAPHTLPVFELRFHSEAYEHPDWAPLLDEALTAALCHGMVRFIADRPGQGAGLGLSGARTLFEGPSLAAQHRAVPQRVTVNMVQAGLPGLSGQRDAAFQGLAGLLDLCRRACFQKRQVLHRRLQALPAHEHQTLARWLPPSSSSGVVDLAGLTEAALLLQREGENRDTCLRTMGALVSEAHFLLSSGDQQARPTLSGAWSGDSGLRCARLDARHFPEKLKRVFPMLPQRYSRGVQPGEVLGIDDAARLRLQGRLGALVWDCEPAMISVSQDDRHEAARLLTTAVRDTPLRGLAFRVQTWLCSACGHRGPQAAPRCPGCQADAWHFWCSEHGFQGAAPSASGDVPARPELFGDFTVDFK